MLDLFLYWDHFWLNERLRKVLRLLIRPENPKKYNKNASRHSFADDMKELLPTQFGTEMFFSVWQIRIPLKWSIVFWRSPGCVSDYVDTGIVYLSYRANMKLL